MSDGSIPETFVVTVAAQDGTISIDMSLPSWIPSDELSPLILSILKMLDERCGAWSFCSLYHRGHQMRGSQTLASIGAYDGSVIVAIMSKA